jgi:hypothetical protein
MFLILELHRTSINYGKRILTAIMSLVSLCSYEHLYSYTNRLRLLVRLPVLYRSEGRGFWVGCEANITSENNI